MFENAFYSVKGRFDLESKKVSIDYARLHNPVDANGAFPHPSASLRTSPSYTLSTSNSNYLGNNRANYTKHRRNIDPIMF